MDFDIIIIGGGVIGLACACAVSGGNKKVALIERHSSFGFETSSRNSEVIHSGIYYPTGSLKADLCVKGNKSLYDWCDKHRVPHRKTGKYIIAAGNDEEGELGELYKQAIENGVPGISKISAAELKIAEPNVKAVSALWSPTTGIIDSHKLMESLFETAKSGGTDFAWKHTVTAIELLGNKYAVYITAPDGEVFSITSRIIINAAGLDSDIIAGMAGIDLDKSGYRLHYVKGNYFRVSSAKRNLVSHLIYPVPPKNTTGLGIHVTIDLDGELKLGPDTVYLYGRNQDYSVDPELRKKFHKAVSKYLKGIRLPDIYPDQSGIRPKLQAEGEPFRDFIIAEESVKGLPGLINLIGIESPGLTCCLEIAELVKELIQ